MSLKTSFDRLIDTYGFDTVLTRPVVGGADITANVRVMRRYAEERPLIHEVSQDSTWFAVRKQELDDQSFPLPIKKGDTLQEDGSFYTVYVAERMRDGPNVIGYRCRTIGD